ncbi:uncharacterized protein LOC105882278 [Microcebus murinus]|uniref:uncharacterized protein LOC105882278 n=1 Tax=Microcebus murinus TaxID=30608 RepID=UPI003F6D153D
MTKSSGLFAEHPDRVSKIRRAFRSQSTPAFAPATLPVSPVPVPGGRWHLAGQRGPSAGRRTRASPRPGAPARQATPLRRPSRPEAAPPRADRRRRRARGEGRRGRADTRRRPPPYLRDGAPAGGGTRRRRRRRRRRGPGARSQLSLGRQRRRARRRPLAAGGRARRPGDAAIGCAAASGPGAAAPRRAGGGDPAPSDPRPRSGRAAADAANGEGGRGRARGGEDVAGRCAQGQLRPRDSHARPRPTDGLVPLPSAALAGPRSSPVRLDFPRPGASPGRGGVPARGTGGGVRASTRTETTVWGGGDPGNPAGPCGGGERPPGGRRGGSVSQAEGRASAKALTLELGVRPTGKASGSVCAGRGKLRGRERPPRGIWALEIGSVRVGFRERSQGRRMGLLSGIPISTLVPWGILCQRRQTESLPP